MFHILVVEDELWIRSAIVELAESAGQQYKVIGEEAWSLIFEYWPTILITDIMMPKKDGYVFGPPMKMAAVIITAAPLLVTYPFLQKYFIQGMLLGSAKG